MTTSDDRVLSYHENKRNFYNPLYYKLKRANTRFVINYGSGGSAKSWTQAQWEVEKAVNSYQKTLVVRKVGVTLRDSVIPQIWEKALPQLRVKHLFELNKSDRTIINRENDSEFVFRGLDDPDKIKSITGVTRVWIEEADQLAESDFNQLNIRLRGRDDLQITLTFNPIREDHWIKARFFDKKPGDVTILHSTYLGNRFIDQGFCQQMDWYKEHDYEYYRVYGLGEWGRLKTGQEFYDKFKENVHITDVEHLPKYPIWITFDFNVLPYMTGLCAQLVRKPDNKLQLRLFREYCLAQPRNTVESICDALIEDYKPHLKAQGLFFTGDASGNNRVPGFGDLKAFYPVRDKLKPYLHNQSDQVLRRNAGIFKRRDFVNDLLNGKFPIEILIDSSLKELIKDLSYVKIAKDGKLQEVYKDEKTGQSWVTMGHTSDALDYLIVSMLGQMFGFYK